jgi:hypothetical protein
MFLDRAQPRSKFKSFTQFKRCCQYPIDLRNVVIRTQAQADASDIPITNGGATIRRTKSLLVHESVINKQNEGESRYYAMSFNYQAVDELFRINLSYTLSSSKK